MRYVSRLGVSEYNEYVETLYRINGNGSEYELCFMGEPEDRYFGRDAREAVNELNRLAGKLKELGYDE